MGRLLVVVWSLLAASRLWSGEPPQVSLGGRTQADIVKKIAELEQLPADAPKESLARERLQALRKLMAFRYLAGVPHDNLALDEKYSQLAQAAARLCEKLGKLDHDPKKNPGLPEDEFKLGVMGTNSCNLGFGHKNLAETIQAYMEDAAEHNIVDLGHRRWCLNPRMQKTGLGRSGQFTAMHCFDMSQKTVPAFDTIAFPPPGPMPLAYFRPHWPWNVSLSLAKYKEPVEKKVKVQVSELLMDGEKKAVALNYFKVNNDPYGVPACVIFRPDLKELRDGQRFLVEIEGLELAKGKARQAGPLRYLVEFFK